jgi:hypothetical protein
MAEERGQQLETNMDEEEKYSGVLGSGALGKYVPPNARQEQKQQKPPISYSSAASRQPPKITTTQSLGPMKKASLTSQSDHKEQDKTSYPQTAHPGKQPSGWHDDTSEAKKSSKKATTPIPVPPVIARASSVTKTPPSRDMPPISAIVKEEKDRLNNERQQLILRQKMLKAKEKEGLMAEFKNFSANFKLKNAVPSDPEFVDILGRGRDKEKEVEKKDKKSEKPVEKKEEKKEKEPREPSKARKSETGGFKLNISAAEFIPVS